MINLVGYLISLSEHFFWAEPGSSNELPKTICSGLKRGATVKELGRPPQESVLRVLGAEMSPGVEP
jgi:hypothetical protein